MYKIEDNLTLSQAEAHKRKILSTESKLKAKGGKGNYSSVEIQPTREAGTVFGGPIKQMYGIFVEFSNPGRKHLSGASAKAQRAYEHIKASLHGSRRKEIAARTVRKMIGEGRINPTQKKLIELGYSAAIHGEPIDAPVFVKTERDRAAWEQGWRAGKNTLEMANRLRKKNPSLASEISEGFHGRPISEVLEVEEEELIPEDTAVLGCLLDITVTRDDGKTGIPIIFLRDGQKPKRGEEVYVCAPDRHNIEFVGGDQEIKGIEKLCGCDHAKQFVKLGHVESLAYLADKHHLEGSNGREEPYEHEFGKKRWMGFGKKYGRPELVYDTRNFKISLVGGTYTIEDEGITN